VAEEGVVGLAAAREVVPEDLVGEAVRAKGGLERPRLPGMETLAIG